MLHLFDHTSSRLFPYINSWMPTTLWGGKGRHICPCVTDGDLRWETFKYLSQVKWPPEGGTGAGPLDRLTPIHVTPRDCTGTWLGCVGTIFSCQSQDLTGCDFRPLYKRAAEKCLQSRCSKSTWEMKAASVINREVNSVIVSVSIHLFPAPGQQRKGHPYPERRWTPHSPKVTEGPQCSSKSPSSQGEFLMELLI